MMFERGDQHAGFPLSGRPQGGNVLNAEQGVHLDLFELFVGELSLFVENGFGNIDFPQIVKQAAKGQSFQRLLGNPDMFCQAHGQYGDIHRMGKGVVVIVPNGAQRHEDRFVFYHQIHHGLGQSGGMADSGVFMRGDFLHHIFNRGQGIAVGFQRPFLEFHGRLVQVGF